MQNIINLTADKQYSFAIIADPQLESTQDYYDDWDNNPNLAFRMYYRTIQKINALHPAFVVIDGDFVNRYYIPSQYPNFVRLTKLLQMPVLLVYGNHDSHPPFQPFFNAQQEVSGFQSLYYSFDAGDWHYIALPCIQPDYQPEALLNWLATDLKANQSKPTIVFSHYHYLPQGLTQLEYYAQKPIDLRSKILDEVLQYGNVKYWLNGHVHNGIQTSVKTAWEYRGCQFITVPTTVLSRNFGEEYPAFRRGLKQGGYFMTIDVDSEKTTLIGHRAEQDNVFIYPDRFRSFQPDLDPRWLTPIPNFAPLTFTNGDFEQGLRDWSKVWRYRADHQPGYITRTTQKAKLADGHILELAVREKGQDWTNDELTEVYQVVGIPTNQFPVLRLNYYINKMSAVGGGYIRLHAYQDSTHQFTMVFYVGDNGTDNHFPRAGKIFSLTATGQDGAFEQLIRQKKVMFWRLHQSDDRWHHLQVDIKALYRKASRLTGAAKPFQANKLFLALGVWNDKIPGSQTKLFFDQVSLDWQKTASASQNDGVNLAVRRNIYQGRFNLNQQGRKQNQQGFLSPTDSVDFENVGLFDRQQALQISSPTPTNRVALAAKERSSQIDTLTGMDGADTFVLGTSPSFATHSKLPSSGSDHFSLITHFTPGIDKIAIHDSFADYRFISGYFGFGASTLKDTQIFRQTESGRWGELLAVVQDVSSLSANDFLFGNNLSPIA